MPTCRAAIRAIRGARIPFLLFLAVCGFAATSPQFTNETLHYTINWPSGLSLGEATLHATRTKSDTGPDRMNLEFAIDAAIPGFQVEDRYRSEATADFCSLGFDRKFQHGRKKSEEKTTFDPEKGTATRETTGGGKSTVNTAACAKDALAYLYFVRRELSEGRLPQSQDVYFGAAYRVRVEFMGTQNIHLGEMSVEADRLSVMLKGPSSDITFEVFCLKDGARTPALVRVPLAMGTFSMELTR